MWALKAIIDTAGMDATHNEDNPDRASLQGAFN